MNDYSIPVKEILNGHGWTFLRHGSKGSHDIWINANADKTVSVNKNMKSRHTANDILSQAGLKERFR